MKGIYRFGVFDPKIDTSCSFFDTFGILLQVLGGGVCLTLLIRKI